MATRPKQSAVTPANSKTDFVKADAFLNVKLKASNDKLYPVGNSGIALYLTNKADAALIAKYDADPDAVEKLNTGAFVYSYTRVDNSVDTGEIEFDL